MTKKKRESYDERKDRQLKEQQDRWTNTYSRKAKPEEERNPNKSGKGVGGQVWYDNLIEQDLVNIINKMVLEGLIDRHEARPVLEGITKGERGNVPDFPFHKVT